MEDGNHLDSDTEPPSDNHALTRTVPIISFDCFINEMNEKLLIFIKINEHFHVHRDQL